MYFIFPGITKVVASKYVKKHQINKHGNRGTITIARCGLESGADGPSFYLVKEKKIYLQKLKSNISNQAWCPSWVKVHSYSGCINDVQGL